MKENNGKELRKLYDTNKQHISAIELSERFDLGTFLIIVMESKMDEVSRLKWLEYSNDSQTIPLTPSCINFLNMQARHFQSAASERKPLTSTHRSYMATVEREQGVWERRKPSTRSCSKFQGTCNGGPLSFCYRSNPV